MTIHDEWELFERHYSNPNISATAMNALKVAFYSGFSAALSLWEQSRGGRAALDKLEKEFFEVEFADVKIVPVTSNAIEINQG